MAELDKYLGGMGVVRPVMRPFGRRARVEDLPDDGSRSIQERPAELDGLKASGTITEEEYDQERAGILGEV
jgi:putative oligomerization/nucleic acid binding protein